MPKITKIIFLFALIILLLCSSLFADFTAKTKTTMTTMMGNIETQTTYLIKGGKFAIVTNMNNPMLAQIGQPAQQETKMIVLDGGKRMINVNYVDSTYSVMDEKMIDSMAVMMQDMGGTLDSLKNIMDVKSMSAEMTGQTKDIGGFKAEEMSLALEMVVKGQVGGLEPTEIPVKVSGDQWGTQDFPGHAEYAKTVQEMGEIMMSGSSGILGGLMPIMKALGIEEGTIEEAMKFATYVIVGGTITISMEVPGMPINIQVTTDLVESSKAAISDSEFQAPKGFKEVEPESEFSGGGLGLPGMGQ